MLLEQAEAHNADVTILHAGKRALWCVEVIQPYFLLHLWSDSQAGSLAFGPGYGHAVAAAVAVVAAVCGNSQHKDEA